MRGPLLSFVLGAGLLALSARYNAPLGVPLGVCLQVPWVCVGFKWAKENRA